MRKNKVKLVQLHNTSHFEDLGLGVGVLGVKVKIKVLFK